MKKKKIWYGTALCVFAVVVTLVLPAGLETATDTFVEWITQKAPERETGAGTEPETEPETGTGPESEPEPESVSETGAEIQPEAESEVQQGLFPQTERTPEAGAVEYETDPPIPSEPEGGWQGNEDLMYEGTGANAIYEKTEAAEGSLSRKVQTPAQPETLSPEETAKDAGYDNQDATHREE